MHVNLNKRLNRNFNVNKKKQRGISTMEYIIMGALVAVASIGAASYFGDTIRSQMGGIASELSGATDQADTAIEQAKTQSEKAVQEGNKNRHMDEYTNEDLGGE